MHFSPTTTAIPTLLLLLPLLTTAHVKIISPTPYGAATLNTNPLLASGADYPCKQRPGVYDSPTWNIMPVGVPQTLAFQGQATHGGGSCQISLTKDTPPTANSVFKVIKSIEGGCPSTNPGNVGTDPFGYGADNFTFVVPEVVGGGNFTLSWTWFNKIGEREMYMNCAAVTVTGAAAGRRGKGRKRQDGFESLPDMFRANIGNGCQSPVSGDVLQIPQGNLGSVVQRIGGEVLVPPVGSCGEDGAAVAVAASSGVVVASSSVASASPATSTPNSLATASVQPPPAPVSSSSSSSSPVPAAAPSASPPAAVAPSTTPGTTTGSCPTPGKSVCSPDSDMLWGTCGEDLRVVYQPVAVGTRCDPELGVEVAA